MIEEIEALKKNDTWELITLPRGKRTVGCRWVYTLKHKADRSIERAHIVAKGFTQTYGIDYLETFAPVAKLNSIPYFALNRDQHVPPEGTTMRPTWLRCH